MACKIEIEDVAEPYQCSEQQTLLRGMEALGRRGIPVGCRGGGCGVCKVQITSGDYRCKKMSRAHISEEEEQQGYVLACRCNPLSDLQLRVVGQMKAAVLGSKGKDRQAQGV